MISQDQDPRPWFLFILYYYIIMFVLYYYLLYYIMFIIYYHIFMVAAQTFCREKHPTIIPFMVVNRYFIITIYEIITESPANNLMYLRVRHGPLYIPEIKLKAPYLRDLCILYQDRMPWVPHPGIPATAPWCPK